MIVLSSQASDTRAFSGLLLTFVFIPTFFYRMNKFLGDSYASDLGLGQTSNLRACLHGVGDPGLVR